MPDKKEDSKQTVQPALKTTLKWLKRAYVGFTVAIGSYVLLLTIIFVSAIFNGDSGVGSTPYQEEIVREGAKGSQDIVAVIDLSGPIVMDDTSDEFAFSPALVSAERVTKMLSELEKNDQVKAIVLKINSPGGSAVAADEIYQKVLEVRKSKPVIAYFSQVAASGGYYVGAAADSIVSHPDSITGSIGVIMNLYEVSDLYEKIGITSNTIKSGQFKDIGSEARELTDEERAQLQTLVDGVYDSFVMSIVEARNMDEAKVRELGDGRIYSGKQAVENGLVDSLGSFDDAVDQAITKAELKEPVVVEYLDQTFFESIFSSSWAGLLPGVSKVLKQATPQKEYGVMYLLDF